MRYLIHEDNMERLEKKLNRIGNKCKKYGCPFKFETIGEEFIKDDEGYTVRYIVVEVEGNAHFDNWEFIASVEWTENGNIINKANPDLPAIPVHYYNGELNCEHCNTNKYRKYTYIIHNTETGDFKQVGKSCLKEFTGGLSAEAVAAYMELYNQLAEGRFTSSSGYTKKYYDVKEYLQYVSECVNKFGFYKSESEYPTKTRAYNYMATNNGDMNSIVDAESKTKYIIEMDTCNFDYNSDGNAKTVREAMEWIRTQEDDFGYIHNLRAVCFMEYVDASKFGLLASLIPTYYKAMEIKSKYEEKRAEEKKAALLSKYIGNIGERITIEIETVECVASWDGQFGTTRIYKITDKSGNVYTWKTSNWIDECIQMVGSIKAYTEFRGVKQTELTRCKVVK